MALTQTQLASALAERVEMSKADTKLATGEEITIKAKPASVDVRARPLAAAKEALPSIQKARRKLGA